jgi:hypothetical protein
MGELEARAVAVENAADAILSATGHALTDEEARWYAEIAVRASLGDLRAEYEALLARQGEVAKEMRHRGSREGLGPVPPQMLLGWADRLVPPSPPIFGEWANEVRSVADAEKDPERAASMRDFADRLDGGDMTNISARESTDEKSGITGAS